MSDVTALVCVFSGPGLLVVRQWTCVPGVPLPGAYTATDVCPHGRWGVRRSGQHGGGSQPQVAPPTGGATAGAARHVRYGQDAPACRERRGPSRHGHSLHRLVHPRGGGDRLARSGCGDDGSGLLAGAQVTLQGIRPASGTRISGCEWARRWHWTGVTQGGVAVTCLGSAAVVIMAVTR